MLKNTITILGRGFSVTEKPIVLIDGKEYAGSAHRPSKKIEIKESIDDDYKHETLAHEVAHMALEETGMNNLFTAEQIEAICDFAAIVSETMRKYDNE